MDGRGYSGRPSEWKEHPLNYMIERMTVSKESVNKEYTRQERKTETRHEAYMNRMKNYRVYYYGTEAEKEQKRKELREGLQSQIGEINKKKKSMCDVDELHRALQEDRKAKMTDENEERKKHDFLKKFKNDNKTLMEMKAEQRRADRLAQWEKEKELLKHNPINWSSTLK